MVASVGANELGDFGSSLLQIDLLDAFAGAIGELNAPIPELATEWKTLRHRANMPLDISKLIDTLREQRIAAYRVMPRDIKEHHGIEQTVLAGGYGYRQVLELVQNGADAILEDHEAGLAATGGNRVQVVLRDRALYVANMGAPLSEEGVDALLSSHSSPKRGNQIGRFGLGFKSLLGLGGRIDIFTKASGGFCFEPKRCRD